MNLREYVEWLRSQGVTFEAEGATFQAYCPEGVLTRAEKEELRRRRTALRAYLLATVCGEQEHTEEALRGLKPDDFRRARRSLLLYSETLGDTILVASDNTPLPGAQGGRYGGCVIVTVQGGASDRRLGAASPRRAASQVVTR